METDTKQATIKQVESLKAKLMITAGPKSTSDLLSKYTTHENAATQANANPFRAKKNETRWNTRANQYQNWNQNAQS